jgi:hypothetical protein
MDNATEFLDIRDDLNDVRPHGRCSAHQNPVTTDEIARHHVPVTRFQVLKNNAYSDVQPAAGVAPGVVKFAGQQGDDSRHIKIGDDLELAQSFGRWCWCPAHASRHDTSVARSHPDRTPSR